MREDEAEKFTHWSSRFLMIASIWEVLRESYNVSAKLLVAGAEPD